MQFARNLKLLMNQKGLTNYQLAKILGCHQSNIAYWLSGDRKPRKQHQMELAKLFNVTVENLMSGNAIISVGNVILEPPLFHMDDIELKEKPATNRGEQKHDFAMDEADEIAAIYRTLDDHGKGAVRAILNYEHSAVVAATKQTAIPNRPTLTVKKRSDGFVETKVYDQPAAAGFGNYLDDPAYHIEQYPANIIPSGTEFGVKISGNSMSPDIRDGATVFVQSRGSIEPGQIGIFVLNGEAYCKKLAVDKQKGQVRLVSLNPDYADRLLEECDDFRTVGLVLGQWNP